MINKQLMSSEKDNWRTPAQLWDSLNKKFNFWIDLAADKNNAKTPLYFDEITNALKQNWYEEQDIRNIPDNSYAWCNPPYGREVKRFLEKASYENIIGFRSVFLIAGRTDTRAFHNCIFNHAEEVYFFEGRLIFDDENGVPAKNCATFPSMLVVYSGKKCETKFFRISKHGDIF